ncbi:hypothetical protein B0H13DRAFT_2007835 [Mycena leptocephala]|nr:hypothetical protein B0H13DRAFT_2007835 [Mycena leptocephala]
MASVWQSASGLCATSPTMLLCRFPTDPELQTQSLGGCGAYLVAPAGQHCPRIWSGVVPTVAPLGPQYFTEEQWAALAGEHLGCCVEGVGCVVCGNALGSRFTNHGPLCSLRQDAYVFLQNAVALPSSMGMTDQDSTQDSRRVSWGNPDDAWTDVILPEIFHDPHNWMPVFRFDSTVGSRENPEVDIHVLRRVIRRVTRRFPRPALSNRPQLPPWLPRLNIEAPGLSASDVPLSATRRDEPPARGATGPRFNR